VSDDAKSQVRTPIRTYENDTVQPRPRRLNVVLGGARSLSAAVAFVGALVGLIFVLWPSLKPQGPPVTKSVTLKNPTLSKATFGRYLDRIARSRAPYEPDKLARHGRLVEFDLVITGYQDKALPLRWQLIDADIGDQIDQAHDILIVPTATTDTGTWHVWVPNPNRRSRHLFVQLELYERLGSAPLGRLRTPLFANT
jgi:hypothetical protein